MEGNIILSPTISMADFFANVKEAVRQVIAEKPSSEGDELLNTKEVLSLCKVSHVTLQNWRKSKKIPFKKIGNKIFYSKHEVLKVMALRQ